MVLLVNHGLICHKEHLRSFMIIKGNGGRLGVIILRSRLIMLGFGILLLRLMGKVRRLLFLSERNDLENNI